MIGGTFSDLVNPRLGPLADNGGPTLTHVLLPGSPAIGAGDPNAVAGVGGVPVHDQRGKPSIRIFGGRIDVGAFEALPAGFLPGDYNHNGAVDTSDYSTWRDTMGMTVGPGTGADGNGDGLVDGLDYDVWKNNFGATVDDLPLAPTGAGALAAQVTSSEQVAANRGELGTETLALAPSSYAVRRRAVGSRLAWNTAKIAAATIVDDGIVARSLAHRNAKRRAGDTGDGDIHRDCATEESPANDSR